MKYKLNTVHLSPTKNSFQNILKFLVFEKEDSEYSDADAVYFAYLENITLKS